MNDYSIPWHTMPHSLRASLNSHGVVRHRSGLEFPNPVPKATLALLLSSLLDFKDDIEAGDENHIMFAIGDTANQLTDQHPETNLPDLEEEIEQSKILRNLRATEYGTTAISLQKLEHRIKACCSLLELKGIKFGIDDFLSREPDRVRATLGTLKKALLNSNQFTDDFSTRFSNFVTDRNRFAHHMWTDVRPELSEHGLPNVSYFQQQLAFIFHVGSEASYFDEVFIGLWTVIEPGVSDQNPELGLELDDDAIPTFIAALRPRPKRAEQAVTPNA
jgi:hypothetical protein